MCMRAYVWCINVCGVCECVYAYVCGVCGCLNDVMLLIECDDDDDDEDDDDDGDDYYGY